VVAFLMAAVEWRRTDGCARGDEDQACPSRGGLYESLFYHIPKAHQCLPRCKSTLQGTKMSCCIESSLALKILVPFNAAQDKPLSPTLSVSSLANRP
jgi:hypothetical protein